uniref:Uncharacterized protein n=1 Tax=Amphimedon queenslandica TaxID=400682 RepID=A0A1X7TSW2_AMPQE
MEESGYIIELANVDKREVQVTSPVMESEGDSIPVSFIHSIFGTNQRNFINLLLKQQTKGEWVRLHCGLITYVIIFGSAASIALVMLKNNSHINDNGDDASSQPPTDKNGKTHWEFKSAFTVYYYHIAKKRIALRDEAYQARVQLAAIDHNHHIGRQPSRNNKGDLSYHRTYRKRTKRWDVVPFLEKKSYSHIPKLIDLFRAKRTRGTVQVMSHIPRAYYAVCPVPLRQEKRFQ